MALAVDMGGTRLRTALVGANGQILFKETQPTPAREGAAAVVNAIASACRKVTRAANVTRRPSLGLCAPGPLDAVRGMTLDTPTIAGFENFPLRQAISDTLEIDVHIEHDGPAAALGEWRFGAGRGTSNFAYVTISTGIGGGFVVDGRLLRGHLGLAGHVGHLPTRPGGRLCFCGMRGHWEAEASGSALHQKAIEAGFDSLVDLMQKARDDEPAALRAAGEAADEVALGLIGIIHLLNPEKVVIGGGVSNALDVLQPLLTQRLNELLLPSFRGTGITKAMLGDDSGLIGAAQLVFDRELS